MKRREHLPISEIWHGDEMGIIRTADKETEYFLLNSQIVKLKNI